MKKLLFSALVLFNLCRAVQIEQDWLIKRVIADYAVPKSFAFDRTGYRYSISEKPNAYKPRGNKKIEIFDTGSGALLNTFEQEDAGNMAFHPVNSHLIAVTSGNQIIVWDIEEKSVVSEMAANSFEARLHSLAFNNDGSTIVSGCCGQDKSLFLFDPRIPQLITSKKTLSQIYGVAFLSDNKVQSIGSDSHAHQTDWDLISDNVACLTTKDDFLHVSYTQGNQDYFLLKQLCNVKNGSGTLRILNESSSPFLKDEGELIKINGNNAFSETQEVALSSDACMVLYVDESNPGNKEIRLIERAQ